MNPPVSGDLLGAASLALGALALFYSLWSSEIESARKIAKKPHRLDRDPDIATVTQVLRARAVPLAIAVVVVATLLAPPAVAVLVQAVRSLRDVGFSSVESYDAVQALFVAIWVALVGMSYLSLSAVVALRRRRSSLELPD